MVPAASVKPLPSSSASIAWRSASPRDRLRIGRLPAEQVRRQVARGLRVNGPVRHQQGARARIEEGAAEAGGGFGAGARARPGVAGREHDPVGVELQSQNLLHGEETVAFDSGDVGGRQCQGRLREAVEFARNEPVRGEDDGAEPRQVLVLDALLVGLLAEPEHLGGIGFEGERDRLEFVGGVGECGQQRKLGAVHALEFRAGSPFQRRAAHRGRLGRHAVLRFVGGDLDVLFLAEHRIAEADELLALVRARRNLPQRLERGGRRHHSDRVRAREPRHVAIAGEARPVAVGRGCRRGRQQRQRQQPEGTVGDDDQLLGRFPAGFHRLEQQAVEFVGQRQVEVRNVGDHLRLRLKGLPQLPDLGLDLVRGHRYGGKQRPCPIWERPRQSSWSGRSRTTAAFRRASSPTGRPSPRADPDR